MPISNLAAFCLGGLAYCWTTLLSRIIGSVLRRRCAHHRDAATLRLPPVREPEQITITLRVEAAAALTELRRVQDELDGVVRRGTMLPGDNWPEIIVPAEPVNLPCILPNCNTDCVCIRGDV